MILEGDEAAHTSEMPRIWAWLFSCFSISSVNLYRIWRSHDWLLASS